MQVSSEQFLATVIQEMSIWNVFNRLHYRLIWLIDWLIDQMIEWFTDLPSCLSLHSGKYIHNISFTSYRVPIYTPGWRAAMWIKCLAEEQKCQALTGMEPATLWSRVKGSLQYISAPPLIDWLIDQLNDWMVYWLIESLFPPDRDEFGVCCGWNTFWMIDWFNVGLIDWLIEWMNDLLIDWLNEWMNEWMNDWLIDWLIDWLHEWLINWLNEWLIDWINDWLIEWLIEWMNDWLINWMNDWLNVWLIE